LPSVAGTRLWQKEEAERVFCVVDAFKVPLCGPSQAEAGAMALSAVCRGQPAQWGKQRDRPDQRLQLSNDAERRRAVYCTPAQKMEQNKKEKQGKSNADNLETEVCHT
jgi:hypothetical protein